MITVDKQLDISPSYQLEALCAPERIVFFDIETTGLSAASANLYLIGAVHVENGAFRLLQWFSEALSDEEALLHAFFGFLEKKSGCGKVVLLHFNGDGFDIPFLQKLCAQYRLPYSFSGMLSIDLFKKIKPYRALLGLPNCKLKTIERFFGIERRDPFDGGQLIYVYEEYLRLSYMDPESCENNGLNRALREKLLKTLLLHNEEDMANLPLICGILNYDELFCGGLHFERAELIELPKKDGGARKYIEYSFSAKSAFPKEFEFLSGPYCVFGGSAAAPREVHLTAELFEGELKYFFSDYKNYYYLPAEDCAVHKSVGEFVEKKARRQATAASCYQKKTALFLPQPELLFVPVFYREYKGKPMYAELSGAGLKDPERAQAYLRAVLKQLSAEKKARRKDCF